MVAGAPAVNARAKAAPAATSWAAQLKPKKRTGNEDDDLANESHFTLLQNSVAHCDKYPGDIVHMHSYCNKLAKKHEQEAEAAKTLSKSFATWGTLKSLPEDYLGQWIIEKSDLTASDLERARAHDKDGIYIIASAGSQIPIRFRLPNELNSYQILTTFLDTRFEQAGKRLATFKRDGRLKEDGSLCFINFSFKLTFKAAPDTQLEKIGHVLLGEQTVPSPGSWVTTDSDFESFWSDLEATIRIAGMRRIPVHTYFGTNLNKFGYPPCSTRSAAFRSAVAECVKVHADKAAAVKVPSEADSSPLKAAIQAADEEAAKARMKSVHEQMQLKVAERKNKRKLSVGSAAARATETREA